jgi:hypothetical protein
MATIRVIDPLPISTGQAAAVTEVQEAMDRFESRVEENTAAFENTMEQLMNLVSEDLPIETPDLDFTLELPPATPIDATLDATLPNDLDIAAPATPDMTPQLSAPPVQNWPTAPVIVAPDMPDAPTFDPISAPVKPTISTDLTVPDAPDLALPALPALDVINVPAFVAPVLPEFNEVAPTFNQAAPNTSIDWSEPVYASEDFEAAVAVLRRMRLGGTGLPAAIEQQIFERGRARLDRTTAKAVAELHDAYAGRGFPSPPGQLQAAVAAVRESAQMEVSALSRDVLVQATEIEVENLRFSVTQGLAAEQMLMNLFSNATQRLFEMARFGVEAALQLYNAQVNVFNALVQGYQAKASVFETIIDAKLAALEAQRLELEAARVRGELNQQKVAIYREQVQAALSEVELYKARLQGVQAQADIVKTVFDGFRAEVQAFGEVMTARKTEADIYRTRVEGETSKIQLGQAQASIFNALVNAEGTKINAWRDQAQVEIQRVATIGSNFGHAIQGYSATVQRANAKVQASLELKSRQLQAQGLRNTAIIESSRAQVAQGELRLQSNVARANVTIKLVETNLTKLFQQADLRARALQAMGQMQATLAGGAMAAQHVSASIGSSASESYSVSRGESVSNSLSESL